MHSHNKALFESLAEENEGFWEWKIWEELRNL